MLKFILKYTVQGWRLCKPQARASWPWTAGTMSTKQQEDDPLAFANKRYTAFDDVPSDMVNLEMGTPGEALLKKSKEIMKKATVHKMVRHITAIVIDDGEVGEWREGCQQK